MAASPEHYLAFAHVGASRRILVLIAALMLALSAIPAFGTTHASAAMQGEGGPVSPKDRLLTRLASQKGTVTAAPRVASSITCNSTWNAVSSPNQGTGLNVLASISIDAANDGWAVGLFLNGSNIAQTLAEHWNGSAWTIVSSPNSGAGDNVLESVVAISSTDAWAVGYSRPDNNSPRNSLTEHWNGSAWSIISNPQVASASNTLFAVASIASNDVWAVGISQSSQTQWVSLLMHWDGTSWTLSSASPSKGAFGTVWQLFGVRFVTSTNVWAVGDVQSSSLAAPSAFIVHWNGTSWTAATPAADNPGGDFLNDVAGTASDLWAVGGQFATGTTDSVLIEHSTDGGMTWSTVPGVTPDLSANLFSLAYISGTNIYAAGATAYSAPSTNSELDHTLIEQYNGTSWAQVTSANPGTTPNNDLSVIAALTANDVWAVGVASGQTLTENFCTSPTITGIAPTSGPAVGGTPVVITGTGFTGAVGVNFGTTAATTFTVNSDTQITATSPAHPGGTVDVTVTVQGTSATSSADQFTYVAPPPVVTGIGPTSGPTAGGTPVTITGTGLLFATAVHFGTVVAASITSNTNTQIVAVSPAEAQSTVDVTVTTAGGTSATSLADMFSYVAPTPVVTSISPMSGNPSGGTSVTITGTGLSFATAVHFGTPTAMGITSNTDTQIVAVSPAGTLGSTADVTVTTAGGTSATSPADRFTYALPPCPTGLSGTPRIGDYNGDGKPDIAFITSTGSCARLSTGSSFGSNGSWSSTPFFGTIATLSGDVTGDGKADLVAVNSSSTWVAISNGSSFGAPTVWSSTPFFGTIGTFLADVNGDGKQDLVAVNNTSVWVMLSTGSGFGAPTLWSSMAFFGNVTTTTGDVTGDGKADLVAVNLTSTWVMVSSGSGFGAPTLWSSTPFYGNKLTLTADVTGDGKADLVAVNSGSIWAMVSTGSSFAAPAQWSSTAFYGTVATLPGDVSGDGKADLVAVNASSIWVVTSTGSGFSAPALWG